MYTKYCLAGVLLAGAGVAAADSITIDGVTHNDVYIRESASMWYVQIPSEGGVICVAKSEVDPTDVSINDDEAYRAALMEQWKANNARLNGVSPGTRAETAPTVRERSAPRARVNAAVAARPQPIHISNPNGKSRGNPGRLTPQPHNPGFGAAEIVTHGYVQRINLNNVSLRQALKAMLRPMNLDYAVQNGFVWISTPQKIRTESFEKLETRYYQLRNASADTLPKIVVRNPGSGGGALARGQGGYGGGQGGYGGGQGGYGGFGGYGGGRGGYGGGQGGYGGGGGGYGGGQIFSNISELFSTIDDRTVGETPAIIGLSGTTGGGGAAENYGTGNYDRGGGRAGFRSPGAAPGAGAQGGQFSNLSDLFTTIDDGAVGEPPAIIE